jgi:far upstream element-binding protein
MALQQRTGCHIQIDQKVPQGQPRIVTITGPPSSVAVACQMVKELIDGSAQPQPQGSEVLVVDVPADMVGRIIGRRGETIKSLQNMSGCHINIDQNFPQGHPRKITMTGSKKQIQVANEALQGIMRDGPNAAVGQTAGTFNQTIEVDASLVGRLIGRGGETINDMQARSKCRIQIDQSMPDGVPRKVTISGISPERVQQGVQIVQEVMHEGPRQISRGMQGGMQNQYGMQQQQQMQMRQAGMYGMPQQQQQQYGYQAPYQQQQRGYANYGAPQQPMGGQAYSPWSEHRTEDGKPYWYNSVTNTSVWERPQ